MTVFEHAMLGWTLALASGCQRRHGWKIAGMAAIAAAVSDLDGLSLLFGPTAYAQVHRVWCHNLLVAPALGALTGFTGYLGSLSLRVQRTASAVLARLASDVKLPDPQTRPFVGHDLAVWVLLGTMAALSHLPADLIYNGSADLPPWPVPLLWPFSDNSWQLPIVPWGDLGTSVILIVEMFAVYRWPGRAQLVAGLTLVAVAVYVGLFALLSGALA